MNKDEYLKKFERKNPVTDLFGETSKRLGDQMVSLIKREGVTYEQAYASLQYAYNKLNFESNFVKIE